ncbi:lanthionine synthetase C family protein [Streptomyces sp. NPDC102340]|uniref:lanthionine synthetase C family protein n=1 Tax=unclassified Streptomyces TaxID=2593676 RepID=UPI0037F25A35
MSAPLARVHDVLAEFAGHLEQPSAPAIDSRWAGQSLASGAAGTALFHSEYSARGLARWGNAHQWLQQATADDLSAEESTGLYLGATAVAFALQNVPQDRTPLYQGARDTLHRHILTLTHRRADAAFARIARRRPATFAEYDTFIGLTGIGAYLLRTDPKSNAMERVLDYLVALTKSLDEHTPGWWVDHDPWREHALPGGHGNFGAAHGITGPLLLLAQALRRGHAVPGHEQAIRTICDHLDTWRQNSEAGPWWPEHITFADVEAGRPHQRGPGRPSWCYGTPGIARAGQLAGIALHDSALQSAYEDALFHCLSDPVQLDTITDTSLCHGWAGLYQTTFRAAHDSLTPRLPRLLPALGKLLLASARPGTEAGSGFLEGDAGCALALATLSTATAPTTGWDACLLID